jgi:hypothetical protein
MNRKSNIKYGMVLAVVVGVLTACKKETARTERQEEIVSVANTNNDQGHLKQTKTFTSAVAQKWQEMQLRILKQPAGSNPYGLNNLRNFAYCGIGLYESVVPGMPSYQSLHGQLTDMPAMPNTEPGKAYHWAASANATLAYLNKNFYSNTSAANLVSMDSLENALTAEFQAQTTTEIFQRSVNFGKTVAQRIFNWSTTDGALTVYPPFVPPVGPGIWSPTSPNPTGIFAPYWGNNKLLVPGSLNNTSSPAPPSYSTDPASAYYAMVKEVYDVSQTLTPDQIATALYFRDSPGLPAGAHYVSIFSQLMSIENPPLDFYALANAKTGIALNESAINCWKIKYNLLQERPVRYIRNVLGHTTWNPQFGTPPHPDFPSGHSQVGGAFATVMNSLLGNPYHFTIHTYDYLGMSPRSYNSFNEMVEDVGLSRVYAGIHYTYSCVEAKKQGEKIAANVLSTLKFQKN